MLDRTFTTDVGAEVLRRSDSLKISMFKGDDGHVSSTFELSGATIVNDDDESAGGVAIVDRMAALAFLRQLMQAFEDPK